MSAYFQKRMEIFQKVCMDIQVQGQTKLGRKAFRAHNKRERARSKPDQLKRVTTHLKNGRDMTFNYYFNTKEETKFVTIGILPEAIRYLREGTIDFRLSVPRKKIVCHQDYPRNRMPSILHIHYQEDGDAAREVEDIVTVPVRGQVFRVKRMVRR